jgi:hypothetical protein
MKPSKVDTVAVFVLAISIVSLTIATAGLAIVTALLVWN